MCFRNRYNPRKVRPNGIVGFRKILLGVRHRYGPLPRFTNPSNISPYKKGSMISWNMNSEDECWNIFHRENNLHRRTSVGNAYVRRCTLTVPPGLPAGVPNAPATVLVLFWGERPNTNHSQGILEIFGLHEEAMQCCGPRPATRHFLGESTRVHHYLQGPLSISRLVSVNKAVQISHSALSHLVALMRILQSVVVKRQSQCVYPGEPLPVSNTAIYHAQGLDNVFGCIELLR
jgi:hypothetical protein